MSRSAIIVLADAETHGDLGRVVNTLLTFKKAKEADDEDRLIFGGAGARRIGQLADPAHSARDRAPAHDERMVRGGRSYSLSTLQWRGQGDIAADRHSISQREPVIHRRSEDSSLTDE